MLINQWFNVKHSLKISLTTNSNAYNTVYDFDCLTELSISSCVCFLWNSHNRAHRKYFWSAAPSGKCYWPIAVMYQSNPTGSCPPPRGAFAYLVCPGGGALTNFVWPRGRQAFAYPRATQLLTKVVSLACSRRSDSGERCEVKRSAKK